MSISERYGGLVLAILALGGISPAVLWASTAPQVSCRAAIHLYVDESASFSSAEYNNLEQTLLQPLVSSNGIFVATEIEISFKKFAEQVGEKVEGVAATGLASELANSDSTIGSTDKTDIVAVLADIVQTDFAVGDRYHIIVIVSDFEHDIVAAPASDQKWEMNEQDWLRRFREIKARLRKKLMTPGAPVLLLLPRGRPAGNRAIVDLVKKEIESAAVYSDAMELSDLEERGGAISLARHFNPVRVDRSIRKEDDVLYLDWKVTNESCINLGKVDLKYKLDGAVRGLLDVKLGVDLSTPGSSDEDTKELESVSPGPAPQDPDITLMILPAGGSATPLFTQALNVHEYIFVESVSVYSNHGNGNGASGEALVRSLLYEPEGLERLRLSLVKKGRTAAVYRVFSEEDAAEEEDQGQEKDRSSLLPARSDRRVVRLVAGDDIDQGMLWSKICFAENVDSLDLKFFVSLDPGSPEGLLQQKEPVRANVVFDGSEGRDLLEDIVRHISVPAIIFAFLFLGVIWWRRGISSGYAEQFLAAASAVILMLFFIVHRLEPFGKPWGQNINRFFLDPWPDWISIAVLVLTATSFFLWINKHRESAYGHGERENRVMGLFIKAEEARGTALGPHAALPRSASSRVRSVVSIRLAKGGWALLLLVFVCIGLAVLVSLNEKRPTCAVVASDEMDTLWSL